MLRALCGLPIQLGRHDQFDRCTLLGQQTGHAHIAQDGALLVRSERGVEQFHSGELSLR